MQFSSYHVKLLCNKMVHYLATATSWGSTFFTQCLADGLARDHQLPGLLGHQT
jgi:hypothetical protein